MADPRTFKIDAPHMEGDDIKAWQVELLRRLDYWGATDYPLKADGDYGVATRSATATVLHGLGIAQDAMDEGVTPELRVKVRHSQLSSDERQRYEQRAEWRKDLADRWEGGGTAAVLAKIYTHANGFSGGHDGADLICPPDSPAFAIVKSKVVRISDNWWGLGAPANARIADKGNGIVILQSLVSLGPIQKGDYFGYGHGEKPRVKEGQVVEAGRRVCDAGLANAWHLHFMHFRGNPGKASDGGPKGIGNRDPWPAVSYCIKHA